MKFGDKFIYNNIDSTTFDLYLVSPDADPDYTLSLSRKLITGETTKFRESPNHLSTKYDGTLEINFMVVKNPDLYSGFERIINRTELRKINAWLTSPQLPKELYFVDSKSHEEQIYYFGVFTSVEPFVVAGEIYGLQLTFTCSSSFGYSELMTYTCANGEAITIMNTSDELESSYYPVFQITPAATGTVTITNRSVDKSITLNVKAGNTIIMDCRNTTIYDKAGIIRYSDLGWGVNEIESFWWPELIYGENIIHISGGSLIVQCRYPRKVGEF